MKKSLFPRLALMAVVVALVSACSQKKQEYTDVIPANAHTVVSINLKSLADKAGLNDKENKEVQEKLTNALKSSMNAATFQQVEMIMKDPKKSGIDVSEPLYIFTTETFPTTIVAKVSSEDDLHALLETLEKEKVCQIFRCTVLVLYALSGRTVSLTCCRSCFCVFDRASDWKFRRHGGRFI